MVKKKLFIRINAGKLFSLCKPIFAVGLAPFGLALTPNISLVIINRFSSSYGGEKAIATYTCISYIICIIYLIFVAITRISTAGFYATEKAALSYILTFIEPVLMLGLMLILPPLFGGQIMIWWSTVFARIIAALLALLLTKLNK